MNHIKLLFSRVQPCTRHVENLSCYKYTCISLQRTLYACKPYTVRVLARYSYILY